jgi:GTP-binding protein
MKITSAEFVLGAATLKQLPKENIREIAFLGRSNVGKSSLIGKMCNRKSLTRVSSEPGKTRELNFFLVNGEIHFVDLPGYGYAKVPEQMRASWGSLIEEYLKKRRQLLLAVLIIDARHEPTPLDKMMVGWLDYYEVPFLVVLTKADKLPHSKIRHQVEEARKAFGHYSYCKDILPFSSVTGFGRSDVLLNIRQFTASAA